MKFSFKFNPRSKDFIHSLGEKMIKVGVVGDGGGDDGVAATDKAFIHEFGTRHIPARPFIRPVMTNKDMIEKGMTQGFMRMDIAIIGDYLEGEVRAYIGDMQAGLNWKGNTIKPLKFSTIDAKGEDALLIDTGNMIQSISSEVISA